MIRRTTWIILVVFVALLGLAWYLQRSKAGAPSNVTPTAAAQSLFGVEESAISGVKIEDAQGNTVALQRDDQGAWKLTEPQAPATDVGRAEEAISEIATMRVETTLEQAPDLKAVGLSPANNTITLSLKSGQPVVVWVGSVTPIGDGYYVLKENEAVQVVNKFSMDTVLNLLKNPPVPETPTPLASEIPGVSETPSTPSGTGTPPATQAPTGEASPAPSVTSSP